MSKTSISNKQILLATLVILLFTLLTLADAPGPPPYGYGLFLQDDVIFAASGYYLLNSSDGGLTWKSEYDNIFEYTGEQTENTRHIDIPNSHISYRIARNRDIEKSIDNGITWNTFHKYQPISSIDVYYYSVIMPDAKHILISSGDMVYEPFSGNVIIANHFDGIGVITNSGEYIPIQVDDYVPLVRQTYYDMYIFKRLMGNYLISALYLFAILMNIWMFFSGERFYRSLLLLSAIIWIFLVQSAYNVDYNNVTFYFLSIFIIVLLILLIIANVQNIKKTLIPHWKITILSSLVGSALFLTPYLCWYFGFLEFNFAEWISNGSIFIWVVVVFKKYHSLIKEKNIGIWKEYKITFFWKPYVFRVYHLTDEVKKDDKE